MEIIQKKWDTDFFGFNVGELFVNDHDVASYNDIIDDTIFQLVYVLSSKEIISLSGCYHDIKLTYCRKISNVFNSQNNIVEFDLNNPSNINTIYDLAIISGKFSRFRLDDKFKKNVYIDLYKKWIDNTINRSFGFKIFTSITDNKISGFITLNKLNETDLSISLISVFEQYRGMGLATDLITYALNFAKIQGYQNIFVDTQGINSAAIKLYEKCGFKLHNQINIYHLWK